MYLAYGGPSMPFLMTNPTYNRGTINIYLVFSLEAFNQINLLPDPLRWRVEAYNTRKLIGIKSLGNRERMGCSGQFLQTMLKSKVCQRDPQTTSLTGLWMLFKDHVDVNPDLALVNLIEGSVRTYNHIRRGLVTR